MAESKFTKPQTETGLEGGGPVRGGGGQPFTPVSEPARSPFTGQTSSSPYKLSPRGTWEIWSRSQGKKVGEATTKEGARRAVDRRDNAYGGYDHYIK